MHLIPYFTLLVFLQLAGAHPLQPLTVVELKTAATLFRADSRFPSGGVFATLTLQEPLKASRQPPREAFAAIFDRAANKLFEATANIGTRKLTSWKEAVGKQPGLLQEDFTLVPRLVRADARWQAALKARGITDFSKVHIDVWARGADIETRVPGARLVRAISYLEEKNQRRFTRPIEGVTAVVDVTARKVVEVSDLGHVPVPDRADTLPPAPPVTLKPLKTSQPRGAGYVVRGNEIKWAGWSFLFSLHPREGLVLHDVRYGGRRILHRASLSETVVPYGDPSPGWAWRNALDVGEYGLGKLASPLKPGVDVPEHAAVFDSVFASEDGVPYTIPRTVAVYERDGGLMWKHYDTEHNTNESRRARELVVEFFTAISNYDYGFTWIFRTDGSITVECQLTGMMLVKAVVGGHSHEHASGHRVTRQLVAPHHQHFFGFRLDFDIDGEVNSVVELNARAEETGFSMSETLLSTELSARRELSATSQRRWKIINPNVTNRLGDAVGYFLLPGESSPLLADENAPVRSRAGFLDHQLWVTRYAPSELYAAGAYPNQGALRDGLATWTERNAPLEKQDIVMWYVVGVTHAPRPEEWPIMPVARAGFRIVPSGWAVEHRPR